ncbi:MAG: antibiotic biosynthesis monooxygenase [Actinomycetota bacterium]|nr:antibiotic biosynthesis monooxygenase [Actinomycetota bacterium]
MAEVVVVALLTAKRGHEEEVADGLRDVAAQTHEEEGCQLYSVHRATDDSAQLVLVERWTSREALDEHFAKPYIQALGQRAAELLAEPPQVRFLQPLPAGDPAKGSIAGG